MSGQVTGNDVFISCKNLDERGVQTRDAEIAAEVYDFLTGKGLSVFLGTLTLEQRGAADYSREIDSALDSASVLLAIGTSAEYLNSEWVRYEWNSFANDIRSGRKPKGRIFTYIEGMPITDLPRTLRENQTVLHGKGSLERLYNFIYNALPRPAEQREREQKQRLEHEPQSQLSSPIAPTTPPAQPEAEKPSAETPKVFHPQPAKHAESKHEKPLPPSSGATPGKSPSKQLIALLPIAVALVVAGLIIVAMFRSPPSQTAPDAAATSSLLQKADAGDPGAMNSLGELYYYGKGVIQDYGKAREWYQKAADAGNTHAMNELGLLYAKGLGGAQDYGKAREWYQKAADAGNMHARNELGWLYQNGKGGVQDYGKAREWYQKAADAGYEDAKQALERLPRK